MMRSVQQNPPEPPAIWQLASHPVRWAILQALEDNDRLVEELVVSTGQPQSLISYHLAKLKQAGIVSSHRSSRDRRASYYHLNLECCETLLSAASRALHPSLGKSNRGTSAADCCTRSNVLFCCTANSARSQMAEALLNETGSDVAFAMSAGAQPAPVHPGAVREMRSRGIDISSSTSKHFDDVAGEAFDLVVTVCDAVRECCPPVFTRAPMLHWSIPDPADPTRPGSEEERFALAASDIDERVRALVASLRSRSLLIGETAHVC